MQFCYYFQAKVTREQTWFFVATLRSFENLAFDRTLDVEKGIFEFFVPKDFELDFIKVMKYMEDKGIISDFKKINNRLKNSSIV